MCNTGVVDLRYQYQLEVGIADTSDISWPANTLREREFLIENQVARIHFIVEMFWWTGLAPWELEFPLPGSLTSTVLHTSKLIRQTFLPGGSRRPAAAARCAEARPYLL